MRLPISVFLVFASLFLVIACQDTSQPDDNEKSRKVIEKHEDGSPKKVNLLNKEGDTVKEIQYYKNGQIEMEGPLKDNKRNGTWKAYYKDGTVWSSSKYSHGKQHGPYTTYYPNGHIRYKGQMHMDKRTGKWAFYNRKGEIVKEIDYDKREE
ncbi:MAG: toxin-antitoxin system YwqK family antitoxin [Bacteroidales bacterium]